MVVAAEPPTPPPAASAQVQPLASDHVGSHLRLLCPTRAARVHSSRNRRRFPSADSQTQRHRRVRPHPAPVSAIDDHCSSRRTRTAPFARAQPCSLPILAASPSSHFSTAFFRCFLLVPAVVRHRVVRDFVSVGWLKIQGVRYKLDLFRFRQALGSRVASLFFGLDC